MNGLLVAASPATTAHVRIVAVGHVDHGKSTLIGRLLHDSNNLVDGKVAELRAASERRGVEFEWSFVLDALQTERDQAITIDTARIWMKLGDREVVLIDAPGHVEFIRNMVTGASDADAALLVVDAAEGVSEQTRRHALVLDLIGVRQVVVAVNKMDRVAYAHHRYRTIVEELHAVLERIGIARGAFVPIVARDGDNIATPSGSMPWYDGPTIAAAIAALEPIRRHDGHELRLAVQGIVRREQERIIVGRVESGSLTVGSDVTISPRDRHARVKSIEAWPHPRIESPRAGESVGFTLDAPVFVERGDIISDPTNVPGSVTLFRARLLWLGERALNIGDRLQMRVGTVTAKVAAESFERVVDVTSLADRPATSARRNDVVEVTLRSRQPIALDTVDRHPALGRFILIRDLDVVAGGTVLETFTGSASANIVPVGHAVDRRARAERNGHRGAVIWLTGLPASGKSTIAMGLESRLFAHGVHAYVLDGDNVRSGLCRDLTFSSDHRRENVRRVGEAAALMADAGIVVIAALISPHLHEREGARRAAGDAFHEIYVKADAAVCESRDPKGHYAKARAGEIPGFTGITGEYEAPASPDFVVDTARSSARESIATLFAYVSERITL